MMMNLPDLRKTAAYF